MLHARIDYMRIQDPAGLIPDNEPVFLLRAQDRTAWIAVETWAALQPAGRARNLALKQAELMHKWPVKKTADVPE